MKRLGILLRSKSVWGAVAVAVSYLTGQDHIGVHEIINAAGGVISAVGVRDAITQHGVPTP